MSTAQEVAQGRVENQAIDRQSVVLHDPFLTSWVNRIGASLAQHRNRRDVTYTFTVIDDQSINAFAIKGGFVHVNAGLLNFVSSDDELAATLGHEMGHVELHHVTKADNANTILGVLASIASIISIPTAILGGIGAGMATDKYSRIDELQADNYGLSIMGQAGYDPQAAVDVMRKLGTLDPGPDTRAEKAFLDHPVPRDRVAHLLGYRSLDRPPQSDIVARAQHDMAEGRYSYARETLRELPQGDQGGTADTAQRSLDFALRESGALASPDSRSWTPEVGASDPRRVAALSAIRAAELHRAAALQATKAMSGTGEMELGDLEHQLDSSQALAAAAQAPGGPQPARSSAPNPKGAEPIADMLSRNLNDLANLTGDVFSSAPAIIAQEQQPLGDMVGPLSDHEPLTPKYAALLPYYPAMTNQLETASSGVIDAVAKARSSIAQVGGALSRLNAQLAAQANDTGPDQPRPGRPGPAQPALSRFAADVVAATAVANEASNELYASQAAALSVQISMLDLFSSPQRYEAYRAALAYRFPGVSAPAYSEALALNVPSGELACSAWLAFETGRSLVEVASTMQKVGQSCETLGASEHLSAESMEIAEGLIYEDYDDAPTSAP